MGWLKCGADGTLLVPGRASTLKSVHEEEHNEHKYTQTHAVYPRVEVTPLLLPVSLYSGLSEVTRLLLELYTQTPISLCMEELPLDMSRILRGEMKWFLASSLAQEGVRDFI